VAEGDEVLVRERLGVSVRDDEPEPEMKTEAVIVDAEADREGAEQEGELLSEGEQVPGDGVGVRVGREGDGESVGGLKLAVAVDQETETEMVTLLIVGLPLGVREGGDAVGVRVGREGESRGEAVLERLGGVGVLERVQVRVRECRLADGDSVRVREGLCECDRGDMVTVWDPGVGVESVADQDWL